MLTLAEGSGTAFLPPAPPAPVVTLPIPRRAPQPIRRPRVFSQPAPDAVDPFAEEFEEEELVLDSFATLASIFGTRTPRVENSREPGLSRLVQNALDATSAASGERKSPRSNRKRMMPWTSSSNRRGGMIRLAVVNDTPSATDELAICRRTRIGRFARRCRCRAFIVRALTTSDDTILVIEDDPAPPTDPQPGVRRESYRQLFSRLRHGT